MPKRDKRGILLFIVIGVIMVVVILSTIILKVIINHARLTHHQVSRIQALYAAKAGVIYALDALRRDDSTAAACWAGAGMIMQKSFSVSSCVITEPDLPNSVDHVDITVGAPVSGVQQVTAKATYTYTPA